MPASRRRWESRINFPSIGVIFLRLDRNGDGRADVIFFDLKRSGRWDLSFWDENYTGNWTLVGYHDDGSLKPTRFESYAVSEADSKSLKSKWL